jgi:hypothetical protein
MYLPTFKSFNKVIFFDNLHKQIKKFNTSIIETVENKYTGDIDTLKLVTGDGIKVKFYEAKAKVIVYSLVLTKQFSFLPLNIVLNKSTTNEILDKIHKKHLLKNSSNTLIYHPTDGYEGEELIFLFKKNILTKIEWKHFYE